MPLTVFSETAGHGISHTGGQRPSGMAYSYQCAGMPERQRAWLPYRILKVNGRYLPNNPGNGSRTIFPAYLRGSGVHRK